MHSVRATKNGWTWVLSQTHTATGSTVERTLEAFDAREGVSQLDTVAEALIGAIPVTARPSFPVRIVSVPPEAEVWVDGKLRGKTSLPLELKQGRHTLKLVKGTSERQEDLEIGKDRPDLVIWKIASDSLELRRMK